MSNLTINKARPDLLHEAASYFTQIIRRVFMKIILLFVVLLLSTWPVRAEEVLVKYRSQAGASGFLFSTYSFMPYQVLDQQKKARLYKIKLDTNTRDQTLAYLRSRAEVEYVVPNVIFKSYTRTIELSTLQNQWALHKIRAPQAWDRAGNLGNRKIKVALIDSGVDSQHSNLWPNLIPGFDFQDNDADPMDVVSDRNIGHGTHCAGVIGASGLIEGGVVGVSPEVSIMPLRFLGENGQGDLNTAVRAIDHAVQHNVHVISASWGAAVPREQVRPLLEAIQRAHDKGIIFVAAAGNEGINSDRTEIFPAANGFSNAITVNATDANDRRPSWSNHGPRNIDLAAPGEDILSTLPHNTYGRLSGTSMSAPMVAGLVAFLLAQNERLTGAQIKALLQATGARAPTETACNCRVDALAAVEALLENKMWTVPFAGTFGHGTSFVLEVINGQPPFRYSVSNPWVARVSQTGLVSLERPGSFVITVTDATGKAVRTQRFSVLRNQPVPEPPDPPKPPAPEPPGPTPAPPPPDPDLVEVQLPPAREECALGDPLACQVICALQPKAPLCN